MNPEEYERMHALETNYWWFVGRRAIVGALIGSVIARRAAAPVSPGAGPGLALLDVGCGTGANLPLLHSLVGADALVVGIDFSPLALQFARAKVGGAGLSLLQGDAVHLPFPDATFDIVTLLDVLEHVNDDRGALTEIRRVLKPGGVVVWSVPAYQRLWSAHDEALHHFRRYEFHDLGRLLEATGFTVWRLSFAMSLMPPVAWLWRRCILPFQPRRPRDAKRHSQGAVLPAVPDAINRALIAYLKIEGRIIQKRPICFGTSLVGAAIKPHS